MVCSYRTNLEIFCVSGQGNPGNLTDYTFYTISPDLDTYGFEYSKLSTAAWIADNWKTWGSSDTVKGEAQKAVWKVTGVMDILGPSGTDREIYNTAMAASLSNYDFSGWAFANSPVVGQTTPNYQDFLVPVSPVPEPATMLLLGTGLIGLAGFGRKRLLKK